MPGTKQRVERERPYRHLLAHAFGLARSLEVNTIVAQAERKRVVKAIKAVRKQERIIWLTEIGSKAAARTAKDVFVNMPRLASSGVHLLRLGLFLAALNAQVRKDERVVCLLRTSDENYPDTILLTSAQHYFSWLHDIDPTQIRSIVSPQVFARVLEIARQFAVEGREGKPIGTLFVLGKTRDLAPYLRQLILNPFVGHPKRTRSVLNPEFPETLRELSALDGAFVVSANGVVESAGTYVAAPSKGVQVAEGLGARHHAAAAASGTGKAVAIVLSESSGNVTVFIRGMPALELSR